MLIRRLISAEDHRNNLSHPSARRGAAVVEFAVCIPVLVLLTIGAIQVTDAIYLKNSLRVVAYETARESVETSHTNADAMTRANEVIALWNIKNATVTFDPADISTAVAGQPITVTVSAPANDNTVMPGWFFRGKDIRSSMVMVRE